MIPILRIPEPVWPRAAVSPASIDAGWLPLRQAWRPDGPERRFQPGWARIRWTPDAFWIDTVFRGGRAVNRATRLNERTWEMGDVSEVFLQEVGDSRYLELHVTPENHRLQLAFAPGDIERLRDGTAAFESFLVDDPEWVTSEVSRAADFWAARVRLPADRFGRGPLAPGRRFRGTFCRYDCDRPDTIVYSATAPLGEVNYHRRADWDDFLLVEMDDTVVKPPEGSV